MEKSQLFQEDLTATRGSQVQIRPAPLEERPSKRAYRLLSLLLIFHSMARSLIWEASALCEKWGIHFHCRENLSAKQILLGDHTFPELFNFVLLVARRFIYVSRCDKKLPTLFNLTIGVSPITSIMFWLNLFISKSKKSNMIDLS